MNTARKKIIPELSGLLHKHFSPGAFTDPAALRRLAQDPAEQQVFLSRARKIIALSANPRIRDAFLRAYLRIYAKKINKDGRHGSLVMEITKRCDRRCPHCYSRAQAHKRMSARVIGRIIKLARENYKHIFITGGEPVLDRRVLTIAKTNPDIMFFMFTNGGKIDRKYAQKLSGLGNLIPVLSIDGTSARQHDYFKGKGSFAQLQRAIRVLNAAGMSWGYLSMVTNTNARQVLSKKFVRQMKSRGAILARYLEYIPVGPGARPGLVPSARTYYLMEKRKKEIVAGGEIYMQETAQKKCLGLLFFDVDGNIKFCPFFHYSKHNIGRGNGEKSIKDSLQDWCTARYGGECPLYSDQEGLKAHLLPRGWKPTVSFNPANTITAPLARVMADNYRAFLELKSPHDQKNEKS